MNIRLKTGPVDVLLVVGDIHAVRQIRETLETAKVINRLHHIGDLDEARAYLLRNDPYQDAPKPGMIIFEASLRKQLHIDLLTEINADPDFSDAQVIVLAGVASQNRLSEKCFYSADAPTDEPMSLPQLAQELATSGD